MKTSLFQYNYIDWLQTLKICFSQIELKIQKYKNINYWCNFAKVAMVAEWSNSPCFKFNRERQLDPEFEIQLGHGNTNKLF